MIIYFKTYTCMNLLSELYFSLAKHAPNFILVASSQVVFTSSDNQILAYRRSDSPMRGTVSV